MAQQKSKYTETFFVRISKFAKEWASEQVPDRFPSFSAYVDFLIRRDKQKRWGVSKV